MEAKELISKLIGKVSHVDSVRCIFLFLLFITAGTKLLAVDYVVTATTLNVRSEPNVNSKIIGKLDKGDKILNASAQPGDWIYFCLNGEKMGYVSTKYLKPINKPQQQAPQWSEYKVQYIKDIGTAKTRLRWCLAIGLTIFFVLWVGAERFNMPLFLAISSLLVLPTILLYYLSSTNYSLWFIYPSEVGWGWTIVNFILFLIVGFWAAMFCIEGIKSIFDWDFPMLSIISIIAGIVWGYDIYLCLSAISHQAPGAFLILFALCPGGYSGATSSSGTLRDKWGHDVDGHFGSSGKFYGKDGKTYRKGSGEEWYEED